MTKYINSVSIIIPAKDEDENICDTVNSVFASVEKFQITAEVIAINDGSKDSTHDHLVELQKKYPSLKIINHKEAWGLGSSFMDGVSQAKMNYVLLIPGDNENNSDSLLSQIKNLNGEDVLITYVENTSARSYFRRLISRLYTIVLNLFFFINLKYYNGTSIYKVSTLRKIEIRSKGFFFSAEILIKMIDKNAIYKESAISLNSIEKKKSNALTFKSIKQVLADFLYTFLWSIGKKKEVQT